MAVTRIPDWALHAANATVDLTGYLGYVVKIDNAGGFSPCVATTDAPFGIITEEAKANKPATAQFAGVAAVVLGAAVTAGARLMVDGNGRLITATSNNQSIGIALQSGALNEVIAAALMTTRIS